MVSSSTAEIMRVAEELNEAGITSWTYREKDVAVRKCPKCGNPFFGKVSLANYDGVFPDSIMGIYCANCLNVYDTDEIDFE